MAIDDVISIGKSTWMCRTLVQLGQLSGNHVLNISMKGLYTTTIMKGTTTPLARFASLISTFLVIEMLHARKSGAELAEESNLAILRSNIKAIHIKANQQSNISKLKNTVTMISTIISRMPLASMTKIATPLTSRALSTHGLEAMEKLKGALEEYRMQQYVSADFRSLTQVQRAC